MKKYGTVGHHSVHKSLKFKVHCCFLKGCTFIIIIILSFYSEWYKWSYNDDKKKSKILQKILRQYFTYWDPTTQK